MAIIDKQKIDEVLTRGVENVYPSREALEEILMSGKKLRIYNGIDPTGKLHIGHLAVLQKLRQLQDLGHEIIVLIGDFTGMIGDPTGKSATRKQLTRKQVLANAKSYKKIIGKILDLRKSNVRFLHNEKWTNKLKPADLLSIASKFTVPRLLERDMFQERVKAGEDIHVHEFLYPIFQAYDSVSMDVDMEVGGNDQMFNMLAGRTLMKKMKNKEKFVLTTKLLVDSVGKKMGKTEGNIVALDESPSDMFGKIMSWPDNLIKVGFELCTRMPLEEIEKIVVENPRDAKAKLGKEIVKIFHGENQAEKAEQEFDKVFKNKELPSDMPVFGFKLPKDVVFILVNTKIASSKNEAWRLVNQGAVKFNSKVIKSPKDMIVEEGVLQVGPRRFARIKILN